MDPDGVLHVRLAGTFPNALFSQSGNLFQPLIEACSTHNCRKALVDARDLAVLFDTLALYRAGKDGAFLTSLALRVALLAGEKMVDRFFEDVVRNSGGTLRVFTSEEVALK